MKRSIGFVTTILGAAFLLPTACGSSSASNSGGTAGSDAGMSTPTTGCPKLTLPSAAITTAGTRVGEDLTYGTAPYQWGVFTYAAGGQTPPTAEASADGNGIEISGGLVPPVTGNYLGAGLYFEESSCIDASKYTGIEFDFSGDLGACTLSLGANFSADEPVEEAPDRGSCTAGVSSCYPPLSVVAPVGANAGAVSSTTLRVPFSSFTGGSPASKLDPSTLITVQWQLNARSGGPGCNANFTVANVAFH